MNNFQDFKTMANGRKRILANNTRLIIRPDGGFGIQLHETEVIIHYPNNIILNTGGWQTVTTKDRMNRFSTARVWSDAGVWMIGWHGEEYTYADGINLDNDGSVCGEGIDPNATKKLRKRILTFSKDYANAFIAGEVPAPGAGDCWGCLMITKDGNSAMGNDHIISHLDEKYYVPSILHRMMKDGPDHFGYPTGTLSLYAKDFIARTWSPDHDMPTEKTGGIVHNQIYKSVRKFCLHELGLPS